MPTATKSSALSIPDAARALGVSPRAVRRMVERGAPVARRGGRGRGRATLIDVAALRAWQRPSGRLVAPVVLARMLPAAIGTAIAAAHREIDGPHKRAAAGVLAGAWYAASCAALDELRRLDADVPEIDVVPDEIARLREIARL